MSSGIGLLYYYCWYIITNLPKTATIVGLSARNALKYLTIRATTEFFGGNQTTVLDSLYFETW